MKNYLLDTNYLLRFLLKDNLVQASAAQQVILQAKAGKVSVMIQVIVIMEVFHALFNLYKWSKPKVISALIEICSSEFLEIEKREELISALELYKKKNISLVDCMLYVYAKNMNLELLTFDAKLQKLKK